MSEAEHIPRHSAQYQEALTRFILFWGEMASRWGINRTMAQIHALLYASEAPLDTDEIMGRLQISRGNASMNLRSLILWDLVRKVHQPGSRKDYYTAEKDVWKITARIIKEREKRELQPVMNQLQECRKMLLADEPRNGASDDQARRFAERIDNLIDLMQVFEGFTQALFPFIQERTMSEAKDLIELASNLVMTGID
jgi:DNA-binding transcriptional regulator GbsR (MarR family)